MLRVKSWLSKAANKKQARCRLCKKNFELSNMGKKTLLCPAAAKKHIERDKINTFFKYSNQKKIANNNTEFKSAKNDNDSSSDSSPV